MRRNLVILCAVLMAVPMASANWTYRGNNEPDTVYDSSTWMYEDSDTSVSDHKIYFNGFARVARETHYNPNVGVLGSRMQPPISTMSSILGFWKDCNNDGYIGMAEQSFLEYKAELLLANSICPPVSVPAVVDQGYFYPHNDGTWIRELIWIGPRLNAIGPYTQNPTNFYADETAVWSDWGLPGASPVIVCPGGNVGIRSTGAILDNADCTTYYRGVRTLNDVQDATGAPVGGWEYHDVDNSPSAANVDNPAYPFLYGSPEPDGDAQEGDFRGYRGGIFGRDRNEQERRERIVTVVDCNSGGVSSSPGVNTNFDPANPDSYPSLYESLNDTFEVATQSGTPNPCAANSPGDQGAPYPQVEGYTEPTFPDQGRVEVDFPAEFSVGSRNLNSGTNGAICASFNAGPFAGKTRFAADPVLGLCPPMDLGTAVERDDLAIGPAWRTNAQINTYTTTTREGLKTDNADISAFYFTFYARVGPAALAVGQRPSTAVGTYGSEACGSFNEGIHNGWNCDADAWTARCNDPELPTLPGQCYRKGFQYHLRDVDCWDGTVVRGAGVRASLADAQPGGPCAGNPNNEGIDIPTV